MCLSLFDNPDHLWLRLQFVEKNESERKSCLIDLFCCLQNMQCGYITSQKRPGIRKKGDEQFSVSYLSFVFSWLSSRWRTYLTFFCCKYCFIFRSLRAALWERSCTIGKETFAGDWKLKELLTTKAETSYWSPKDEKLGSLWAVILLLCNGGSALPAVYGWEYSASWLRAQTLNLPFKSLLSVSSQSFWLWNLCFVIWYCIEIWDWWDSH